MKPSTRAHRTILAAFERYGNTLTAAQLAAARVEVGVSKRAWERERARMAKECDGRPPLIKRSRIGNGSPQSGDGTVTWTLLRPNMTKPDLRGMHAFLADIQHASREPVSPPSAFVSKYRYGSRKYWRERNRRECDELRQEQDGELAHLSEHDRETLRKARTGAFDQTPTPERPPCRTFVDTGRGWCQRCGEHVSRHSDEARTVRLELVRPTFGYGPMPGSNPFDPF